MSTTTSTTAPTGFSMSPVTTPARILVRQRSNLGGSRFVGITGITDPADAQTCIRHFMEYTSHRSTLANTSIALGLLTSQNRLIGGECNNTRSLSIEGINDICCVQDSRVQYIVHLCTKSAANIGESLNTIRSACPNIHGVQLNTPFLQAGDLRAQVATVYGGKSAITSHTPLFLSIEPETLREWDWNPDAVTVHVSTFVYGESGRIDPCIDRVIIDPSEGKELVMDPEKILPILRAIHKEFPGLPLICSGGLSGKTVTTALGDIVDEIPCISTDAEGGLRTSQDCFDCNEATGYIQSTLQLFEDAPSN